MKSKNSFLVIAFIAALFLLLNFKSGNSSIIQPAAGNDGAPNTIPPHQTCAQCHSGGAPKDAVPNVDFTFNDGFTSVHIADFQYEPSKTYLISYIPLTTSKRYGFQMSALTSTNANGGTFALTDPINTALVSTPTTYVSHHNASSFHFWTFQWTAPATNVGDITFYYVFNAADSSNTEQGDTIYAGSSVIHAATTAIEKLNAVSNLSVFPNPVANMLNVSFDLQQKAEVEMNLFSIDGKRMKLIYSEKDVSSFNQTIDVSEFSCGTYLLKIQSGENVTCRKILVE